MAAGSKRVRLYIDSDATGVQKGVGQAQRSLRGFEGQAKKTQGVMGGLGSTASSLGLAFGAAGLAVGIKSSIDAFKEQEKATARVVAQLKTLGINTDAVRKKISDVTAAQSKLSGFQDEDLQSSFTRILRVTGDVTESLKLNRLAMDISRGSGKDLGAVAVALSKVLDGNVGALGRYGVKAQTGATITDVLTLAQKRYAGQAREFGNTTAGAADKANAQINELQESIGSKLAPAMNSAAGATISFANATQSVVDHAGGLGPVLSGAAGFGAFQVLAPQIGKAGGKLKELGAISKVSGGGLRGLGAAAGSMVTPMGVAAVGAGLLAAGVYEIWHTSENADQAIQGLNDRIKGLNEALDQKTAAKDAVKSAKDYVKVTKDAENAARARAGALHGDLVELEAHKHTEAQVEAATKKWKKALDDVVPAVHARERATHSLDTAQKNLVTSTDGVNVAAGEQNRKARDVVTQVQALTRDVRVAGKSGVIWRDQLGSSAEQAEILAGKLDKAAKATRGSDKAISIADSNLAGFTRHIQRIPTIREIKLVTRLTQQGMTLDQIKSKIDALNSKTIAVRVQSTFGNAPNPITGISPSVQKTLPKKRATGGMIPGRYSDGDRVPAMLSGGEAVLNPLQIGMVDSGMSVMGALSATGAPTIGAGFAGGKKPTSALPRATDGKYARGVLQRKGGRWYVWAGSSGFQPIPVGKSADLGVAEIESWLGRGLSPALGRPAEQWWESHFSNGAIHAVPGYAKGGKPGSRGGAARESTHGGMAVRVVDPMIAKVANAIDRRSVAFGLRMAMSEQAIVNASGSKTIDDDLLAYSGDTSSRAAYRTWLGKVLSNPSKALGVKGAKLNAQQRTSLINEQTAQTRAINENAAAVFALMNPEKEDSSGDGSSDGSGEAGSTDTGPTPDQQALLDQKQRQIDVLTRSGALSEAALRGFGSSGDIGTGNFANAFDAARGGPQIAMLGDARSLQAFAAGATAGMGLQPSISANAGSVRV